MQHFSVHTHANFTLHVPRPCLLSPIAREAVAALQSHTSDGGAHVVTTSAQGQAAVTLFCTRFCTCAEHDCSALVLRCCRGLLEAAAATQVMAPACKNALQLHCPVHILTIAALHMFSALAEACWRQQQPRRRCWGACYWG